MRQQVSATVKSLFGNSVLSRVFDFCSMIVMIDMTAVTVTVTVIVIVMTEEDEMIDTPEGDCPLDLLPVIVCMCTCVLYGCMHITYVQYSNHQCC